MNTQTDTPTLNTESWALLFLHEGVPEIHGIYRTAAEATWVMSHYAPTSIYFVRLAYLRHVTTMPLTRADKLNSIYSEYLLMYAKSSEFPEAVNLRQALEDWGRLAEDDLDKLYQITCSKVVPAL